MANGKNNNYVSIWFWMFALFIMALPCVGLIMIIVWAFVGENESRKNFFRAVILWALILTALWIALIAFGVGVGVWPEIQKQIQTWSQHK
jgi:hypothetical protein